jgi:hypothetical protein
MRSIGRGDGNEGGVVPPHVQRGGGGGWLIQKRGGPLPPDRFFGSRGPPLAGHGRLIRVPSEVHRKRWPSLWSKGGVPPTPQPQGRGLPPVRTAEGSTPCYDQKRRPLPPQAEGGAYPPLRFLAGNKEQELVGNIDYEYS